MISQIINVSPLPGLTLRGWARARWDGVTFTQFNGVGLALTRTGAGAYTATLAVAAPDLGYLTQVAAEISASTPIIAGIAHNSTTVAAITTYLSGVATDPTAIYVAIYA